MRMTLYILSVGVRKLSLNPTETYCDSLPIEVMEIFLSRFIYTFDDPRLIQEKNYTILQSHLYKLTAKCI